MNITLPKNLYRNGFNSENKSSVDLNSIKSSRDFIRDNLKKTKSINKRVGSYKLKHAVEIYYNNNLFMGNGDFIAAMILEGYEYKRESKDSPNAYFNLSQKSIKPFL